MGTRKIKFHIPHAGYGFCAVIWLKHNDVIAFGLDNDAPGNNGSARIFRDDTPEVDTVNDEVWRAARDAVQAKLGIVNDLVHAGMPWAALTTCKNSATLLGAIIEAADQRLRDVLPRRRPEPPLTGGPAARAWSRESSK